jgi:hypothetical protein
MRPDEAKSMLVSRGEVSASVSIHIKTNLSSENTPGIVNRPKIVMEIPFAD